MQYPLFQPSSQDSDSPWSSTARLYNWYREPSGSAFVLRSHLGMTQWASVNGASCRAMAEVNGDVFAVIGATVYQFGSDGSSSILFEVVDDPETTISGNNGFVTVCAGGNYYLWNGSTLSRPASGAFNSFGSVEFLNQLTVLTERGGRRIQWSDVAEPATLDGLAFATAENNNADIIRAAVTGSVLWVFKSQSLEIWSNNGANGLSIIPGQAYQTGLLDFRLLAKTPAGLVFVGDDRRVYQAVGTGFQAVSSPGVETSIKESGPLEVVYFEDDGHKFCAITFRNRAAWVYDMALGEWSERGEGVNGPWTARASAIAFGRQFVGDDFGRIHELTRSGKDNDQPMIRRVVGQTVGDGNRFRVPLFRVNGTVGTIGGDAGLVLETSKDKGATWFDRGFRSLGERGAQERELIWRGLGQHKTFTARLGYSGPEDITIGAWGYVETA